MLPDVIDEATLAQGVRREELFYAFFVFVVKTASGLGAGLSALSYELVCNLEVTDVSNVVEIVIIFILNCI